ncbi:MAG: hypothetical protein HYU70_10150 [Bacteroidetes bacterium]|nr:hypothetical protein [Bacteroidota bacterium]
MRVLIIGDFSGSGNFLAEGFTSLGVDVTHIAYQNAWRENPIQINLTSKYKGVLGRIDNYVKPFTLNNIKGYDAVVFVNNFSFPRTFGISAMMSKRIQDNNKASYYWVMGCDSNLRKWGRTQNFELCNACLMYDQKSVVCVHENDESAENEFLKGIDKIIPSTYEYYMAHKNNPKVDKLIQIPVSNKNPIVEYSGGPVNFFHGLNRYGFKGTFVVEKAFSLVQDKYVGKANFLIKGKMPYAEYTSLLAKQDVIVDQIFNQCLGVNSLLALAQGKVLVAGNPLASCELYGYPMPPMIVTEPSVAGVKRSIEAVMDNVHNFKQIQESGIEYVKKYHTPEIVARKFLNAFEA